MATKMLRLPSVRSCTGKSKSTIYQQIKTGLFPPPVPIGPRATAWSDDEVDATNRAWLAGKSPEQIRRIVANLVAARTVTAVGVQS